jgi:hypothetical protein
MTTAGWLSLFVVILVILSAVFAAIMLAEYGTRAFYAALELYYGRVKRLADELEKSRQQEQRGAENYETLGQMYDRLADKYRELSATVNAQAEIIKNLRNKEPGQALAQYGPLILLVSLIGIAVIGSVGYAVYLLYAVIWSAPW